MAVPLKLRLALEQDLLFADEALSKLATHNVFNTDTLFETYSSA
jgi:hypothetical protein